MKLEEHFKNALKQAVSNEPPVVDARARFEARVTKTRRTRIAMSALGLAAVAIAAVVVVPRVLPDRETEMFEPGPGTESPTPKAGIDTTGWSVYSGNGWTMKHSPKWRVALFEGDTEFVPQDLKGTAVGEPTFALIVRPEPEAYDAVALPSGGETVTGTWNDGRKYRQWRSTDASKPRSETVFEIDADSSLHVIYYVSTVALWDAHVREADASFDSLTFTATIEPKHGAIAPGVEFNQFTRTLVDFMDARIEKSGAEPFLAASAAEYYAEHRSGLYLYSPTSNPHYTRYDVLSWQSVEGNIVQATFVVQIVEEYTGSTTAPATFCERIGIGPGGTRGNAVHSAERLEGCD